MLGSSSRGTQAHVIDRGLTTLLLMAYPIGVFVAVSLSGIRWLGLLTLFFGLLRLAIWAMSRSSGPLLMGSSPWVAVLLILLGTSILCTQETVPALLYPVVVNMVLLFGFVWSLVFPPSAIERIARVTEPDLPDYAVRYTRRVTWVWCVLFLLNGIAALYTALFASLKTWTLYNGGLAYVLMGIILAGEYMIRRRVRAAHEASID
jgi:uncharacterized membrane protein